MFSMFRCQVCGLTVSSGFGHGHAQSDGVLGHELAYCQHCGTQHRCVHRSECHAREVLVPVAVRFSTPPDARVSVMKILRGHRRMSFERVKAMVRLPEARLELTGPDDPLLDVLRNSRVKLSMEREPRIRKEFGQRVDVEVWFQPRGPVSLLLEEGPSLASIVEGLEPLAVEAEDGAASVTCGHCGVGALSSSSSKEPLGCPSCGTSHNLSLVESWIE